MDRAKDGFENLSFLDDLDEKTRYLISSTGSALLGEENLDHLVTHAYDGFLLVDIAVPSRRSPDT